jgi:hypothetical protein
MLKNLLNSFLMISKRALTQLMAAIGDPIGRLETEKDLAEFSVDLRSKAVQRSRIGILMSADYEICADVLKSSMKLEAEAVWRSLLMRFPDVGAWKLDGEVVAKKVRVVRGLESLQMKFGPENLTI